MDQNLNSYQLLKKDFKKYKSKLTLILIVFVIAYVGALSIAIYSGEKLVKKREKINNDYEVRSLMQSTQFALRDYFLENKIYPDDLNSIKIKHNDDTFKIISPNEIECLGYTIYYIKDGNKNFRLETNLKGNDNKYIIYNDL